MLIKASLLRLLMMRCIGGRSDGPRRVRRWGADVLHRWLEMTLWSCHGNAVRTLSTRIQNILMAAN